MKYHSQLIKKYLSLNCTPEEIANNLIVKTVEIEEIIERNLPDTIVVGKIMECHDHPDSDHMHVCQVDCGDKGQFQIVCGASNVAEGMFVPVALEGTYFKKMDITIAKRKLRGIDSQGMICSKNELGIQEDTDQPWIWELTKDLEVSDADLGTLLSQKWERINSIVFDIDNKGLTHRPDLTGHFGLAWDLNAMYADQGKIAYNKIKEYQETFRHTNIFDLLEHTEKKAKKSVICKTEGLRNYILLELNNVQVKQSDFFMRLQNLDLGNNCINNWVDFSNIFMNIAGQPVHFFDADKLEGNIVVRDAEDGEKFTDLLGKEHTLTSQDIVIADEKKALCLGGVMGGENSGITENTKNIIIEIANFDPVRVRKTGVRLGLRTESELRNEKNINPTYSLYALLLMLDELQYYKKDLGDFEIGGTNYYLNPKIHPQAEKNIEVDWDFMEQFIFGEKVENFQEKAEKILTHLGFTVSGNQVKVPLRRGPEDINIEADLIEEIARIRGYEKIKTLKTSASVECEAFSGLVYHLRRTEETLVESEKCSQLETYPWISEKMIQSFGKNPEDFLKLTNPVNTEAPYLRDSLVYPFIQVLVKNFKFFDTIRAFDTGKVWTKNQPHNTELPQYAIAHIDEQLHTGVMLYKKEIKNWEEDCLLDAKGMIQKLLKDFELFEEISYETTEKPYFHPKKQGKILYKGKEI
ncbi:phenylalanine--tRNA ligase subunit beta [bacterium]|nr:phenylalanine--tRNA ligase subunit beta [bacterium]